MNGYAGVTDIGEIVLCGVPDRPKTLPHHPDYDEVSASDPDGTATPLQRLRIRLQVLASHQRGSSSAGDLDAAERPTADQRFPEAHRLMALAYKMYGQLDREGKSAVDRLRRTASDLPADERRELEALAAGWFSAFEVLHIRVDEGMEVRDLLEERTLWISERSATRQLERGDLIASWVLVEGDRFTLDGAVCHVPARMSAAFIAGLRKDRDALKIKRSELDWRKRNGLLSRRAAPLLEEVFGAAPTPTLVNHDGDKILFSSARYDVLDSARVEQVLSERFHRADGHAYEHVVDEVIVARLVLSDRTLRLECNSKRRLTRSKTMLKKAFGAALRHRADTFEDPEPSEEPHPRAPEQDWRVVHGCARPRHARTCRTAWADVRAASGHGPRAGRGRGAEGEPAVCARPHPRRAHSGHVSLPRRLGRRPGPVRHARHREALDVAQRRVCERAD